MVEEIRCKNTLLAVIVRNDFQEAGIHFFTPDNFSQQLGYMKRPTGYVIQPHVHLPVKREVEYTKEVLFIKKGVVRVDFYDNDKNYLESRKLGAGDVILLAHGGHGFEILEEAIMIEVKQGPYAGTDDKIRFNPISHSEIKI